MPALQVREFPAELYDELRVRAAQENRSIAQQTIVAVREHLHPAQRDVLAESASGTTTNAAATTDATVAINERAERRRRAFERLEAYPKVVIPDDFPSPAEIVRQMRDER